MALEIRSIKGTQDVLPADTYKWQFVERLFLDTARLYGFNEIRIPTFEDKSLFIQMCIRDRAYGIQEKGVLLVREIRGDYCNVVGLPLAEIARTLSEFCEKFLNS